MAWKPTEFGGSGAFEICLLPGIELRAVAWHHVATDALAAATLMRTQSAATKLPDHRDSRQKIYSDDIVTYPRPQGSPVHTAEPVVDPKLK